MTVIGGIISLGGAPIGGHAEEAVLRGPSYASQDGRFVFRAPGVLLVQHAITTPLPPREAAIEDDQHVIVGDARDLAPILDAYRRFDDACTDHLDGDFTFAIWNKPRRRLFAATDHFGARPLFYSNGTGGLVFSSDMEVVTAPGLTARRFDADAIVEAFAWQYRGATYDTDVRALPGGSSLTATASGIAERKYWQLRANGRYRFGKDDDWPDCVRELMLRAVRKRLDTERPVGVLLSGGLDSSFVTALAAKVLDERNKPLFAFSNALPDGHDGPEQDERKWATLLVRHLPNVEHRWMTPPADVGPFTNLAGTFAQIHALPNPFHYMDRVQCEAAREANVGTLLSGHGGDHTVSYRGDRPAPSAWSTLVDRIPFRHARHIRRELQLQPAMTRRLLERGYYGRRTHRERVAHYVGGGGAGIHYGRLRSLGKHHGLEQAMPIWDRDILEFFMDVPPEQFVAHGTRRSLARRAMAGLVPDEIRARSDKQAFSPDSFRRLRRQEHEIRHLLGARPDAAGWKYVDREKLTREVDAVLATPTPHQSRRALLTTTLFVLAFAAWLEQRGYRCQ